MSNDISQTIKPICGSGLKFHPVLLSYCATFLKPEMLHVYRQVTGISNFRNIVATRHSENATRFPYRDLVELKKSPWRAIHRSWHRWRGERVPVSRSEANQLDRICQSEDVSLIHIYFGTEAARLLGWMARVKTPVIVSFHGADVSSSLTDAEFAEICRYAKLILHRSDSLRQVLLKRGAPEGKLRSNPTGVPISPLEPLSEGFFSGPLRILQACRFISKKGLDVTLRAVKLLKESGYQVELTLAGDGPEREALQAVARQEGIESCVRWTGFLDSESLSWEYARHGIFVHPSRETSSGDREGIPNSLIEAMAAGRVVVGTRHSGIPEVVTDGFNGRLIDRADPEDLAQVLREIASRPSDAISMASEARRTVVDKFSSAACVRQLEACYNEALKQ
ncbi:MAG: colanic acid biosynthesis glycosyltransferase WcaL [Spartobacteria bacterium]|nr:colanic acid biosynthesis glycosyltransferase WcaL [Spartobacteria bacterium]